MTIQSGVKAMLVALLLCVGAAAGGAEESAMKKGGNVPDVRVRTFLAERSLTRAGRPVGISAVVANAGEAAATAEVALEAPAGIRVVGGNPKASLRLEGAEERELRWQVQADEPLYADLRLRVTAGGSAPVETARPIRFLPRVDVKPGYIPEPKPAQTRVLVGAHHCPLWEADKPGMWKQILKHPERVPALGFYAQENPEVSDWETKWAVEHGISFFIYCWYRASQGKPVEMRFGSAIHEGLFKSRYAGKMKFTIMWENQSRGQAGVADENDLMGNLLPFWIENYFKHPSYLKVDNRPVLFIYRPEFLIKDLGSEEAVLRAFDKMRQACRDAGFDGLTLLGEYRGLDAKHLGLMKRLGLDYTFAYCWHIRDNPTPEQAISTQMGYIRKTQELGVLPQVVTVSQAWSGWRDEGSIWKIPPREFEGLLRQAKEFVSTLPANELGSRMLLLDNWNEWGEGHYLAPYTEYGFGYVDAVRKVFSDAPDAHVDLIPEDLGMGPYDRPYRERLAREVQLRRLLSKKVAGPGAPAEGLIGWWRFDEEDGAPVALDYAGNRLGGEVRDAERAPGVDGKALVCHGGCVTVPGNALLSPRTALTVECWVKTDVAGQSDKWFANRMYGGAAAGGFRFGLAQGRPCFAVPLTDWSHHLAADVVLPLGKWVHLAGTFDGQTIRLYVDGAPHGQMERPGPLKPSESPLTLGSYEAGHVAHFQGLLDEVRLYSRALTPEEIARRAKAK